MLAFEPIINEVVVLILEVVVFGVHHSNLAWAESTGRARVGLRTTGGATTAATTERANGSRGFASSARNLTTPGASTGFRIAHCLHDCRFTIQQTDSQQTRCALDGRWPYYRGNVVPLPGLRRLRILAALSQGDLAQQAGIQRQTVNRLEHGGEAEMATVRKLADALKCEPRDLIGELPETC